MWFFRALAFDLDGTLTDDGVLRTELLDALAATRAEMALLLVTGRVRSDLDRAFPGLVDRFDAVVTENGAVIDGAGRQTGTRLLFDPVDRAVEAALADRGVAACSGQVLLAIGGDDATIAAEVIGDLGLDHQVVRNRDRAMILPAGVTKGHGMDLALSMLGLSAHNAVAVGDAENDLTLLRDAEIGVAVANAVPSLREHADLVLERDGGLGVLDLLRGPLLSGARVIWPQRHAVTIGTFDDGSRATAPGAQASVLVTGDSGSGKSYLVGLLAERWIDAGYSVLVVDPEGDHVTLAEHSAVTLVDASVATPHVHDLLSVLRRDRSSAVIDLSRADTSVQNDLLERLPPAIAAERARHGVPHWVIYDEAHRQEPLHHGLVAGPGICLATWRPELLESRSMPRPDVVICTSSPSTAQADQTSRATLEVRGQARPFTVGRRDRVHVRHQHKYAETPLPPDRWFYFHGADATEPPAAASLQAFQEQLAHVDPTVVAYHADRGDFSRWVAGALADHELAADLVRIENEFVTRTAAAVEYARDDIRNAIQRRYLGRP